MQFEQQRQSSKHFEVKFKRQKFTTNLQCEHLLLQYESHYRRSLCNQCTMSECMSMYSVILLVIVHCQCVINVQCRCVINLQFQCVSHREVSV